MITTLFKFTDNLNYKNWQIGRRRKNIVDLQLLTIDSEFKFKTFRSYIVDINMYMSCQDFGYMVVC
ncbi:unnamed protein product [Candida parapsilosis]